MRTPGHDEELVRGFLYSEGVVSSAEEILSVGPVHSSPEDVGGSVINVQLASTRKGRMLDREFYSNASCGVCGKKTIESLEVKGAIANVSCFDSRSLLSSSSGSAAGRADNVCQNGGRARVRHLHTRRGVGGAPRRRRPTQRTRQDHRLGPVRAEASTVGLLAAGLGSGQLRDRPEGRRCRDTCSLLRWARRRHWPWISRNASTSRLWVSSNATA